MNRSSGGATPPYTHKKKLGNPKKRPIQRDTCWNGCRYYDYNERPLSITTRHHGIILQHYCRKQQHSHNNHNNNYNTRGQKRDTTTTPTTTTNTPRYVGEKKSWLGPYAFMPHPTTINTHTHTHNRQNLHSEGTLQQTSSLSHTHHPFLYCLWGAENFIQRECNIYENFATVSSKRH